MSTGTSIESVAQAIDPLASNDAVTPAPQEQLEIEGEGNNDDNIVYPHGSKLWLTMISLFLATFIKGLDLTIVSVAVPSLTDEFKSVSEIGWYNAAL